VTAGWAFGMRVSRFEGMNCAICDLFGYIATCTAFSDGSLELGAWSRKIHVPIVVGPHGKIL
jgi:hypothetical protein